MRMGPIPLVLAAASLAQPAVARGHRGNAPPLFRHDPPALRTGHPEMAGALARHRGWLRHRSVAPARRLSPHPGFRYRGRVTVERATETVSFDTGAGTLSSKATLSVRALATLSSLTLHVPRVVFGGTTVSDSAGPLNAIVQGPGLYRVSLRQPLSP